MKKHLVEISALIILSGIITGIYITAFTSFFHPFLLFLLFFSFVFLLGVWVYTFKQSVSKECAILSTLLIALLLYAPFKNCIHLNMVISTEQEGEISLYYAQSDQNFNEGNCIKYNIKSDKNQEVAFSIPVDTRISTRIDLDNITDAKIHSLVLKMFNSSLFVYQTEDVTALNNIDIHYENGDMYIHASGDDPHFVLPSFLLLPYLIIFVVMACCILLPLSSLACVLINKLKPKYYSSFVFLLIFLIAFTIVFMPLLQNMKISPSNLLYQIHPWSNSGIRTQGPILSDPIDAYLPKLYDVKQNGLNIWTNYNRFGLPINPFVYLFDIFKLITMVTIEYGTTIASLAKFVVAFLGMYFFLKSLKINKNSAFLGAFTYMFSSAMVMWSQWDHTTVMALAPIFMYFLNKSFDETKMSYSIGAIIVLIMMYSANMIAYVGYFLYLSGVFMLYKLFLIRNNKNLACFILLDFIIVVVVGTLCGFIFFSEMFENVLSSGYLDQRETSGINSMTFPLENLKLLIAPYARSGDMHINEKEIFMGCLFLIVFFIPCFFRIKQGREREIYFWWIISFTVIIILFTELLNPLFVILPVLNTSYKIRILAILNFSGSVLLSLVMNNLVTGGFIVQRKRKFIFICCLMMFNAFAIPYFLNEQVEMVSNTLSNNRVFILYLLLMSIFVIMLLCQLETPKKVRYCMLVIIILNVMNLCSFAKHYIPYIENTENLIPENELISKIQKESGIDDRMTTIGTWNFPANTNRFYQLQNIRIHELGATNPLYKNFMENLDSESYVTSTFTSLTSNLNYNLLKYSSIKTIIEDPNWINSSNYKTVIDVKNIKVLVPKEGSYKSAILKGGKSLIGSNIKIVHEKESIWSHIISEEDYLKGDLICINFNQEINLQKGDYLRIDANKPVKIGLLDDGQIDVHFYAGEIEVFEDSLIEHIDSDNRFYITRNIKLYSTHEEILEEMGKNYLSSSIQMTEDDYKKLQVDIADKSIHESESIKNINDQGDHIEIQLHLDNPAFLVITDSFHKGWQVKVNGKNAPIIRANYLFKGIYLADTGDLSLELHYNDATLYMCEFISFIGYVLLIIVIVFRKKLEVFFVNAIKKKKHS